MGLTWLTPTEITPTSADSWQDCDVSGLVPSGTAGVIVHLVNASATVNYSLGWRKNASTDARTEVIAANSHFWAAVGVDGSRILEVYVGDVDDLEVYLVGYFDSTAAFWTNAKDKSLGAGGTWTDIDLSADTGASAAIGALFELASSTQYGVGFRKNGSTDSRTDGVVRHGGAVVGLDGSKICEAYVENAALGLYLVGYVRSAFVFNTNATDVSIAVVDEWQDLASFPSGASGAAIEVHHSVLHRFGLREDGSSESIIRQHRRHAWALVEAAYGVVEGRLNASGTGFYVVGHATGGPTVHQASVQASAAASVVPSAARYRPASAQVSAGGAATASGVRSRPGVADAGGHAALTGSAAAVLGGAAFLAGAADETALAACLGAGLASLGARADVTPSCTASVLAAALCQAFAELFADLATVPPAATLFTDVTSRLSFADHSPATAWRLTHPTVVASARHGETLFEDQTPNVRCSVLGDR